jgi:hypothetical protein
MYSFVWLIDNVNNSMYLFQYVFKMSASIYLPVYLSRSKANHLASVSLRFLFNVRITNFRLEGILKIVR